MKNNTKLIIPPILDFFYIMKKTLFILGRNEKKNSPFLRKMVMAENDIAICRLERFSTKTKYDLESMLGIIIV